MTYHPEGGSEFSLHPAATEANLTGLQCNTTYSITVVATAGEHRKERTVLVSLQGILNIRSLCLLQNMMVCIMAGPHSLSAAVLSPTSVHLTWVAPCDTQQYHIYYRGTCGSYINDSNLETDLQQYTFKGLQENTNYTFTVNQSGFSGGRVFSTGPAYARTFTAGMMMNELVSNITSHSLYTQSPQELHSHWRQCLYNPLKYSSGGGRCLAFIKMDPLLAML